MNDAPDHLHVQSRYVKIFIRIDQEKFLQDFPGIVECLKAYQGRVQIEDVAKLVSNLLR